MSSRGVSPLHVDSNAFCAVFCRPTYHVGGLISPAVVATSSLLMLLLLLLLLAREGRGQLRERATARR